MPIIGEFEVAARAVDPAREPDQFRFCGELFTVTQNDLTVPLGRFAQVARAGIHADDMQGLAAMLDVLEASVIDADRERFLQTASRHGADAEVLFDIITAVIEVHAGRPTPLPSDSSDGQSTTGESSKVLLLSEEGAPLL